MSLQVSYKKQFIFFVLLAVIFLIGVEVLVNIWLYTIYRCDFEDNEIFKDVDPKINRKVCIESIGYGFTKDKISWVDGTRPNLNFGGLDKNLVNINSEEFRGPEFTQAKQDNTYRIFAVGGSTTFGIGVMDNQTFPFYLEELYDGANLGLKVEVINAGWPGKWSLQETKLIKERLINFEPDLFIVYDGVNELQHLLDFREPEGSPTSWKQRWIEICELGKQHGFETIITLQPLVGTGKKILTEQEYESSLLLWPPKLEIYPTFVTQLDELKDHCNLAVDLRGLFDNERGPIYFDEAHTGARGNQIIAQKFYSLSLPIVVKAMDSPDFNLGIDVVRESNTILISNDNNVFVEGFYFTTRDLISNYMTPRIFPLIFQQ